MREETLIPLAYNHGGNLVTVKTAIRGHQYVCPDCGGRLMFRNSGKTGPGSRRAHFAHIGADDHRCTGESVLHAVFKEKAATMLRSHIEEGKPFMIGWQCDKCGTNHQGNLLYMAISIDVEHDLGLCRPDVAILDRDGNVVVAFEVVVTHPPTEETLRYYHDHGIVLCRVDLEIDKADEQLADIAGTILQTAKISFCKNLQCANSNMNAVHRILYLSRQCPNCHRERRLFFTQVVSPVCSIVNDGLEPAELEQAKHALPTGKLVRVNGSYNQYAWGIPCGCSSTRPRRYPETYYDPKVGRFVRRRRL